MMRNLRRFSAWGALLLLASGCSWFTWLPWVDDDSGAEALEPAKLVKFDPEARIGREWRGKVGDGLGRKYLEIQPAIAADRIFAADGYGLVDAYDVFTGKRIWRARIGEIRRSFRERLDFADRRDPSFLSGGVGVAHGRVLLGTTQGEVIALSAADGSEEWRVEVGGEVLAPPVGGQNLIFVQTIDGRLIALERADGAVRWSFDNPVPVLSLRGTSSPVYGDGVVYAGFANGMVVAIRAENGEPIW